MSSELFSDVTYKLTHQETDLLPVIIEALRLHIGKAAAVTADRMSKGISDMYGIDIPTPRIRKLINHIRNHNLVKGLIANSEGYYVCDSVDELVQYIGSLAGRESAIAKIRESMSAFLRDVAAAHPDDAIDFIDRRTRDIYDYIYARISPDKLPPYNLAFVAGLTYAIHNNVYRDYIANQDLAFIRALYGYFIAKADVVRADIIRGQVIRLRGVFDDILNSDT